MKTKLVLLFIFFLNITALLKASSSVLDSSFESRLQKMLQQSDNNHVGRLLIDDRQNGISQATWLYVNAALNHYKKTKPVCIVLELNTPGGEVFAAQRISDALKEMDTQYECPVIAYINNWAISAGAMLAYSCRFIVIAKDASMGAAEPVQVNPADGAMEAASEKVNSALRTDFANRAAYFGRNPDIAEAMVDKDVILVRRHGSILKLHSEDEIIRQGHSPDEIISTKGKLLTLTAEQMIQLGVADKMLQPIPHQMLSDTEEQSGQYPLDKTALAQIEPLNALVGCVIETYQMNWQTHFFAYLATPAVSSILFLAMLVGFYVEISSGGFGVAGVVAVTSLFLILLSSFAMEAIHWLEPLLLLFGMILIALEVFFFPTLGLLGVLGALFLIVGLMGMMLPGVGAVQFDGASLNAAGEYVLTRLGWLSASLLLACVIIALLSRYMMPQFHLFKRFILEDTPRVQGNQPEKMPKIGAAAIVLATLRPAGTIVIDSCMYDAMSSGSFIESGKAVRIVRIEGAKIVVEESV